MWGSGATEFCLGCDTFGTLSRHPSGDIELEVSSTESGLRGEVWSGDINLSIKIHGDF